MSLYRRSFVTGSAAAALCMASGIGSPLHAQSRVRNIKSEVEGVKRPWRHKKMNDPTGTAPTPKVERFELRNGDCKGGDCKPNMGPRGPQTRARVEHHVVTNLSDGENGRFIYSVYFPSREYNFLPNVLTATGQIFLYDRPRSDWDGGPLWMLESDPGSRKLFIKISSLYKENGRLQSDQRKRYPIGELGRSIPMDQWLQFVVDFSLKPDSSGYVKTYLNRRPVMQYKGPTAIPGVVAGYSYGIYQVRTNQYPGGAKEIPPQVVYYSGLQMTRS